MDRLGQLVKHFVACRNHATLTGGDDLVVLEAETTTMTETAQLATLETSTTGLSVVLDHHQLVLGGQVHQPVHIASTAAHMHGHDRLRA